MVGVPTSNRCGNCRIRKKKCDEQKPSCSQCIRGGWTCPGYKTQWKFVNENARLEEYYFQRKYAYDTVDLDLEEAHSEYGDENNRLDLEPLVWNGFSFHNDSISPIQSLVQAMTPVPRFYEINPLGSQLAYCLESKVKGILIPLRFLGDFFEYIPARLGHSAALDDAISCLCALYCKTSSTPYEYDKGICQSYARAISSLRSSISDTSQLIESETLCASIILQTCELVINFDKGEWSNLVRGTAFLLFTRGAQRCKTEFDYAMLESQLSYILLQSIKSKEHCFLASPEWQGLIKQSLVSSSSSWTLRSRLCGVILVNAPSLIIHCSKFASSHTYQPGWEERSHKLISSALEIAGDLKRWLITEAEPLILSHTSSKQCVEGRLDYPDLISAVLDCVANTTLLTMNKLVRSLCKARLLSTSQNDWSHGQHLEVAHILDSSETIGRRRQRALSAFEFVQAESKLAARALELGLQQIQSPAYDC